MLYSAFEWTGGIRSPRPLNAGMWGPARTSLVVLAGQTGAEKSSLARRFLKGALGASEFVDADVIARGVSSERLQAKAR